MVCKICGAEYTGNNCPICSAKNIQGDSSQQQQSVPFEQFDYFPKRQVIRQMEFSGSHQNPIADTATAQTTKSQKSVADSGYRSGIQIGANAYQFPPNPAQQPTSAHQETMTGNGVTVCPKCGNVLHSQFCGQCGYFSGGANENPYQKQAAPVKKTNGWLIALIVSLAVILLLAPFTALLSYTFNSSRTNDYTYRGYRNFYDYYDDYFDDDYYSDYFDDYFDDYNYGDDYVYGDDYDDYYDEFYEDFLERYQEEYDGNDDEDEIDAFEEFMERYFEEYYEEYFGKKPSDDSSDHRQDKKKDQSKEIPKDKGQSLYPSGVSNAEYAKLKKGMTYAEVSAIIGGDGEILEYEDNVFVAVWPGEYNLEAIVTIEFEDGKVTDISQEGLF